MAYSPGVIRTCLLCGFLIILNTNYFVDCEEDVFTRGMSEFEVKRYKEEMERLERLKEKQKELAKVSEDVKRFQEESRRREKEQRRRDQENQREADNRYWEQRKEDKEKSSKTAHWIIGGVVSFVVLVGCCGFFIHMSEKTQGNPRRQSDNNPHVTSTNINYTGATNTSRATRNDSFPFNEQSWTTNFVTTDSSFPRGSSPFNSSSTANFTATTDTIFPNRTNDMDAFVHNFVFSGGNSRPRTPSPRPQASPQRQYTHTPPEGASHEVPLISRQGRRSPTVPSAPPGLDSEPESDLPPTYDEIMGTGRTAKKV